MLGYAHLTHAWLRLCIPAITRYKCSCARQRSSRGRSSSSYRAVDEDNVEEFNPPHRRHRTAFHLSCLFDVSHPLSLFFSHLTGALGGDNAPTQPQVLHTQKENAQIQLFVFQKRILAISRAKNQQNNIETSQRELCHVYPSGHPAAEGVASAQTELHGEEKRTHASSPKLKL
jgi:hypothetical protein